MKTLWFVPVHNHSANRCARFLCTAATPEEADRAVIDYLGDQWRCQLMTKVCETPETIFMEV